MKITDKSLARFVKPMQDLPGQHLFQYLDEAGEARPVGSAEADGALPLNALAEQVSARLGNTPAIARKSYLHPAVIALVDSQVKWRAKLKLPRATQGLSRYERALIELLESGPSAAKLIAAA